MTQIILYANHSFELQLVQTDKATGEDVVFATGAYKAFFCKDQACKDVRLTLTEDDGIEITSNDMRLIRTKEKNTLTPGDYYLDVRNDIDANLSSPVFDVIPVKVIARAV